MKKLKTYSYISLAMILVACAQTAPPPHIEPDLRLNKLGETATGGCVETSSNPCLPPDDGGCITAAGTACPPPAGGGGSGTGTGGRGTAGTAGAAGAGAGAGGSGASGGS